MQFILKIKKDYDVRCYSFYIGHLLKKRTKKNNWKNKKRFTSILNLSRRILYLRSSSSSFLLLLLLLLLLLFRSSSSSSLKCFFTSHNMDFRWSLSYNKINQVSRTLLTIPMEVDSVVVFMLSIHPLIYTPSSFFSRLTVLQLRLVSPSPSCSTTFSAFWQSPCTCLVFRLPSLLLSGLLAL